MVSKATQESQLSGVVLIELTDEHQREGVGIDRTGSVNQKSIATVLHKLIHDDQQTRREESSGFLMEIEQKVETTALQLQSCHWKTVGWVGKRSGSALKHQDSSQGRSTSEMAATMEEEGHPNKHQKERFLMYRCTSVWWERSWRLSYSSIFVFTQTLPHCIYLVY